MWKHTASKLGDVIRSLLIKTIVTWNTRLSQLCLLISSNFPITRNNSNASLCHPCFFNGIGIVDLWVCKVHFITVLSCYPYEFLSTLREVSLYMYSTFYIRIIHREHLQQFVQASLYYITFFCTPHKFLSTLREGSLYMYSTFTAINFHREHLQQFVAVHLLQMNIHSYYPTFTWTGQYLPTEPITVGLQYLLLYINSFFSEC